MAIHNFGSDFTVQGKPPASPGGQMPALKQLSHVEGGNNPFDGSDFLSYKSNLEEFLIPGFRSLDEAMKQYWTGIRVPTKDAFRFMRVKIAGGDKSLLIWGDDLKEGRIRLPVAALNRRSHQFNPDKFSPRYHSMTSRFVSSRGDRIARVYRPVPYLVDYDMSIWAEHKRDAEYILYQVLTRFHPLAEFRMSDGKLEGNIQLRFGGSNDASDKETGYDQHATVRLEVSMTAEAWLPLPEEVLPTVLGHVTSLRETIGNILPQG